MRKVPSQYREQVGTTPDLDSDHPLTYPPSESPRVWQGTISHLQVHGEVWGGSWRRFCASVCYQLCPESHLLLRFFMPPPKKEHNLWDQMVLLHVLSLSKGM